MYIVGIEISIEDEGGTLQQSKGWPRYLKCYLLGAASCISVAISAPYTRNANSFSVSQIANPGHVASGVQAYYKALNKYKVQPNKHILAKIARISKTSAKTAIAGTVEAATAVIGNVTATPVTNDKEYLCPVQIGTPPQTLNLDFDTGSADLWVFSTSTRARYVSGQTLYAPANSTSASTIINATWDITYGDGSASSGEVYLDKVQIGAVAVQAQAVEAATTVSNSFTADEASSGILGLGFNSINTVIPVKQDTWIFNANKFLSLPLFTVNLKKGAPGNFNFGYIDESEFSGAISYIEIDSSNGFWEFNGTGYAVGQDSFIHENIDAIADTGTSLLLLPNDLCEAYWNKVDSAVYSYYEAGYIFNCTETLPDLTLGFAGKLVTIPGSFINYAQITDSGYQCYGGLQSSDGIGISIYGDILFKAQFVVFDYGNVKMGLASKDLS